MNKSKLIDIIKEFSNQKVLVVGDLIVDRYLWCNVDRISPEAPVPVALIKQETNVLGGASNTANNLAALGSSVDIIGRIGSDADGKYLIKELSNNRVNTVLMLEDKDMKTIVKARVMCGNHQMIRIDREEIFEIKGKTEEKIFDFINQNINKYKVIVLSDYAKGLLTQELVHKIISLANTREVMVLADPTPKTFYKFKGSYLIKPNRKEAEQIAGIKILDDYSNLKKVGKIIKNKLKSEKLIITLGKDGMAIFNGENNILMIETKALDVFDVSGAGDSTIAAIACSLSAGANLEESAEIGNFCAGVAVGKLGTSTCCQGELIERISNE